jgi:hypothetical protein
MRFQSRCRLIGPDPSEVICNQLRFTASPVDDPNPAMSRRLGNLLSAEGCYWIHTCRTSCWQIGRAESAYQ